MFNPKLSQSVEHYCRLFLHVPESGLERQWAWKDHNKEGIRFSFFVTLQELHQLAVELACEQTPPTPAQRILGQYHAAYLDLQAAILGLSAGDVDKAPTDGEWPVRQVYAHILGGEIGFSAAVRYALERHRAGDWTSEPMSDEDEIRLIAMSEAEYRSLLGGSLAEMQSFHQDFHPKLVSEFASISDTELDLPSTFWETTRFPIRHRLHRFEAHIAQHTVQIDKTLASIGCEPSETKRLSRKIYAALADAESAMIGVDDEVLPASDALSMVIADRTAEISALVK